MGDTIHTPLQGSVDNFDSLLDDDPRDHGSNVDEDNDHIDHDERSVASSQSYGNTQQSWRPDNGAHDHSVESPIIGHSQVTDDHVDTTMNSPVTESPVFGQHDKTDTVSISSLPSYNQVMMENSNIHGAKKKIIPVTSDSSESSPSSPSESPQPHQSMSLSSRYRRSQQSQEQTQTLDIPQEPQLGQKLKNSFSKYSFYTGPISIS